MRKSTKEINKEPFLLVLDPYLVKCILIYLEITGFNLPKNNPEKCPSTGTVRV